MGFPKAVNGLLTIDIQRHPFGEAMGPLPVAQAHTVIAAHGLATDQSLEGNRCILIIRPDFLYRQVHYLGVVSDQELTAGEFRKLSIACCVFCTCGFNTAIAQGNGDDAGVFVAGRHHFCERIGSRTAKIQEYQTVGICSNLIPRSRHSTLLTTIDCVLTIAQAVQLEVSTVLLGHGEGYICHQAVGQGIHFTQCHGSHLGVGIQEGDCLQCSIGLALTGYSHRIRIGICLPASGILSGEFGVLHLILRR